MQSRKIRFVLAVGIVLACAAAVLGQSPSRSTAPKTLWSKLGIPQFTPKSNASTTKRRQMPPSTPVSIGNPLDAAIEAKPVAELPTKDSNTASENSANALEEFAPAEYELAESFTKVNMISTKRSSRRSVILKRESARL